ncbi:cytochrome P460 family protein [Achromobacter xylosoxidans]
MKRKYLLAGLLTSVLIGQAALARGNDRVEFPANYRQGVHYATVERGGIREEIFTSQDAISAAKSGKPLPSGTVITMEDYREGKLFRYIVMEKRSGWGERYPESTRNGDWEFQAFHPDRTVNRSENVSRCMGCHKGQAGRDYVFTLDRIKSASVSQLENALHEALTSRPPGAHGPMLDNEVIGMLAASGNYTPAAATE